MLADWPPADTHDLSLHSERVCRATRACSIRMSDACRGEPKPAHVRWPAREQFIGVRCAPRRRPAADTRGRRRP